MASKGLSLDLSAKKQRKRSDYVYHLDYRTRWQDNDMFQHLNNPIYGVLIDSIINDYLMRTFGYNTTTYPYTALVGHSYCDFFGETQYPKMLDVGLRVAKLGRSSVMYEVGIFEQGTEAVKAVGGFVQIWVKREDRRPTKEGIPAKAREALVKLFNGKEEDLVKPKL
nr:hypothetical protein CFP56_72107 [Quercus suber]